MESQARVSGKGHGALHLLIVAFWFVAGGLFARATGYPSWWASQGLLSGTAPNDYAAANQGQAKNMAVSAVNELDSGLAQFGGAGAALESLAAALSATTAQTNDFAAVNLGQLKTLARPFYDRLLALGYTQAPLTSGTYPWLASGHGAPNDYAIANLGQLKYLFSFDPAADANGNGLPDWWEQRYGLSAVSGTGTVAWSGGQLTYLQAYQQGLNPIDFYNGLASAIAIVSGNNQTGPPGRFVPAPLVVSVSGTAGPLIGAPVVFTVAASGTLWKTNLQALGGTSTLLTDGNGQAKVYFQLPNIQNVTCQISAAAGVGTTQVQVSGTESSDNGSGAFADPFDPSNIVATLNSDGSVDVSWTNNTDPNDTDPINIQYRDRNGNWVTAVPNVPAGTTSYHVPAQ